MADPTIADFISTDFAQAAADPQVFADTSGLDPAGRRVFAIFGTSGTTTSADPAGGTDDTSTLLVNTSGSSSSQLTYMHEINVLGAGLDATISWNLSGARRAVSHLLAVADINAISTIQINAGSNVGAPASAAFDVTGGPRNVRVVSVANGRGAHITNAPEAPSGYTMVGTPVATAGNNPSSTVHTTVAVAERVYLSSELTWTGDTATVSAATWQGFEDIDTQLWSTLHWGFLAPLATRKFILSRPA